MAASVTRPDSAAMIDASAAIRCRRSPSWWRRSTFCTPEADQWIPRDGRYYAAHGAYRLRHGAYRLRQALERAPLAFSEKTENVS